MIPGIVPSQNSAIRAALIDKIGVGRYEMNPLANGKPCHTLAVTGNANDGAIVWNEQRCLLPKQVARQAGSTANER